MARALLVLIVLNLMMVVKLSKTKPDNTSAEQARQLENMLLNNIYFMMESEGAAMDPGLSLETESGEIFCLAEILSGKPLLFLRYSELNCKICVDNGLDYLKALADSIGHENVVILASYRNLRDLSVFRRVNQIPFTIYRINEGELGIPAEKLSTPYLFIADNKLSARHVHIPLKEMPRLSRIFLSVIPGQYRKSITQNELSE